MVSLISKFKIFQLSKRFEKSLGMNASRSFDCVFVTILFINYLNFNVICSPAFFYKTMSNVLDLFNSQCATFSVLIGVKDQNFVTCEEGNHSFPFQKVKTKFIFRLDSLKICKLMFQK